MNEKSKLKTIQRICYLQNCLDNAYLTSIDRTAFNNELKASLLSLSEELSNDMDNCEKVFVKESRICVFEADTARIPTNLDGFMEEFEEFIPSGYAFDDIEFEWRMTDEGYKLYAHNKCKEVNSVCDSRLIHFNKNDVLGYLIKKKKNIERKLK